MSSFEEIIEDIIRRRLSLLYKLSGKEILVPTFEQIVYINKSIMELYGGIHEIKDKYLLHSTINFILNHVEENNPLDLSFLLFQKIVQLRPFVDGNKRTAIVSCDFMLKLNSVNLEVPDDFYYWLCWEIDKGKIKNFKELKQEINTFNKKSTRN